MDHRTGSEEEKGLEKRMSHHMENSSHIGSASQGKKHISQLAHGRIGQHFFNIILPQGNGGCKDGCGSTNDSNYIVGYIRMHIEHMTSCNHVDACCNHGSRVDQCGYRCG